MTTIQDRFTIFHKWAIPTPKTAAAIENIALGLWIIAVVTSTLTHELWRDETRQYLMATGTNSFTDYFNLAKYDGHPLLWRTILMAVHLVIPHPVSLQMASLVIGYFSVHLFVKHSPFPLLFKVLFIFGIIPFSVNAVDARDYGISMLLFFALAMLVSKKEQNPLLIGLLLFLQANSNSYGMYLSGLFLAGWIAESGFHVLKDKRYLIAAIVAVTGVVLSYYSTRIDAESVFVSANHLAKVDWPAVVSRAFRHPGDLLYYIMHVKTGWRDLFVAALIVAVGCIRPYWGITLFLAFFLFNIVGLAIIYPQTRHQGVIVGFTLALFWMILSGLKTGRYNGFFRGSKVLFHGVLLVFLLPFLLKEIHINYLIIREEAIVEKSTAQAIGKYLTTNAQLHDAIIIGSPEYAIEPVAYYSNNRIYLVQEKALRNFVRFSKEFEHPESLRQLLEAAEELHNTYKVPIIIALGYFGAAEDKAFGTIYRGPFVFDEIDKFKEKTVKLAEFNTSLGDENFQIFLYLPPQELKAYRERYMQLR
jgi:hypothetical protein